MATAVKMWNKC